ncbi:MAG: IS66 family transposase [Acetobacteraceae bacterium]|nr:IS66 family transposase [Acetobacteraceae bacterium]
MRATPDPIPELPETADALRALLLAAWAERDGTIAERDEIAAERDALALQNDRLRHLLLKLKRMQFGAKSERLPDEQLQLGLEDIEQAIAQDEAEAERRDPALKQARAAKRRTNRGALPAHLPRIEVTLEPEDTACPCCQGAMAVIGQDSSERLDVIPAQFRVVVTRRPKLACRACEGVVVQAAAPARLIEGGLPTEAMVAHVLVARYADHLPLYRQAQMMARQGVELDRSTLAFWVGYAAAEVAPVVARLREMLLGSARLFADETRVPVLDPGRGRTKTGYFWTIARDDRAWGGTVPPAVVYSYAPGRGQEHNDRLLGTYRGIVQCDGYATYKALAAPSRGETGGVAEGSGDAKHRWKSHGGVTLVYCWSHVRRGFYDLAKAGNAPIATEALARIAALYRIETDIRGKDAGHRLDVRRAKSQPLVADLRVWFEAQVAKLPARGPTAVAIRYALNHWNGLERFLNDGRIELDTNSVERAMRPVALSRKNSLFAGSDEGGANWAAVASLVETCKLNGVEPHAYFTDLLTRLVHGWPNARIDELMPWQWVKSAASSPSSQ